MTGVRERTSTAAPTDRSQLRFLRPADGLPDEGEPGRIGTGQVLRLITRQLFAVPVTDDPVGRPVPDVAREVPTVENAGISADGRTWRVRVRSGVYWDAQRAREVGATDAVRGLKRTAHPLARPMRPYFGALIEGLADYYRRYDEEFGHWAAHAPALAQFSHLTRVPGLRVEGDTVVLRLTEPASDLIDLLATGYAALAPREYDYYVPDSPELYRCNPACGPYRIARQLTPGGDFVLEPNPRWDPATDPIRRRTASRIDVVATSGDQPLDDATDFGVRSWDLPASPARFGGTGCSYYLSATPGGTAWSLAARRALTWAVDRAALAEAARAAGAVGAAAQHGVLQPGDPGAAPDTDAAPDNGDLTRGRHLLADAGLTPGSRLVLAVPVGSRPAVVAAAVADVFIRYGVDVVTVSAGEPGADLTLREWTPRWAGNANRDLLHRIWPADGGSGDPAGVATEALRTLDPATATTLWRRFDRMATADLRLVPLIVADWPRTRANAVATGVARW
ncbi:ABC transporter substrate-binding protein [Micromonospora sediminimaris]|uniref:ABC transporter substrate-binding protein n=1 Tax=Micromonospora sediminimaris TaxID=547162 RepID=UPI0037981F45